MRPIDFQFNYPLLGTEAGIFADWLQQLAPPALQPLLASRPGAGQPEDRAAAQRFLGGYGLHVPTERVFLTAGGHLSLTLAIRVARLEGSPVAADSLSYSNFFPIAAAHHMPVIACTGDRHGMLPDALSAAASAGARAVYLMPTVHNPLGTVMPLERRRELAAVARHTGLTVLEDDAYAFLEASPPPTFASLLPEQSYHVYSFSKPFAPLLKACILTVPAAVTTEVEPAVILHSSGTSLVFTAFLRWLLETGILEATIAAKRKEGSDRQRFARNLLRHCEVTAHPGSYHQWIQPERRRAAEVCEEAERQGVLLSPGRSFAIERREVPDGFRLALGGETDPARFERGLRIVAELLRAP